MYQACGGAENAKMNKADPQGAQSGGGGGGDGKVGRGRRREGAYGVGVGDELRREG